MTTKALTVAAWVYAGCMVLAGILVSYWLWWPITPYVSYYEGGPSPILNPGKVVHPGEVILFGGGGIHYTNGIEVVVSAQLVNSFLLGFPSFTYVTSTGDFPKRTVARYVLPEFAPPGQYRLVLRSVFHVNPLRDISYTRETETFLVEPGPVRPVAEPELN